MTAKSRLELFGAFPAIVLADKPTSGTRAMRATSCLEPLGAPALAAEPPVAPRHDNSLQAPGDFSLSVKILFAICRLCHQ
jgi:hypothetical protein